MANGTCVTPTYTDETGDHTASPTDVTPASQLFTDESDGHSVFATDEPSFTDILEDTDALVEIVAGGSGCLPQYVIVELVLLTESALRIVTEENNPLLVEL